MSDSVYKPGNCDASDAQIKGPISIIVSAMQDKRPVIVCLRNNHKFVGKIKAFDKHLNMILEDTREMWTDYKTNRETKKTVSSLRNRYISKTFVRGDNVVCIVPTG